MNIESFKEVIRSNLSDYRYNHSINVAKEAVRLAKKYGADPQKAEIAGILHDITKEKSRAEQLEIINEAGVEIDEIEKKSDQLLHAISGYAYLKTKLNISDNEILNSVRYHTTGRAGMSLLERVIFIADFISQERNYDGVEEMRAIANQNLELAMIAGVSFVISDILSKKIAIAPDSINLYNSLILKDKFSF